MPPLPTDPRARSVRPADPERRNRQRPGRPAAAGPSSPGTPRGSGVGIPQAGFPPNPAQPPAWPHPTNPYPPENQPDHTPVPAAESTQVIAVVRRRDAVPGRAARDPRSPRDPAAPPSRTGAVAGTGPGREPARSGSGRGAVPAAAEADPPAPGGPTRHSANNRPGRLPAAIGIGAALAMIGGLVLILTNGGLSPNPTAPTALPGAPTRQIVVAGGSDPGSLGGSASPLPRLTVAKTTGPTTPPPTVPTVQTATAAPTAAADMPVSPPPATSVTHVKPAPTPTSTFQSLSKGSSGTQVTELQDRLELTGYLLKSATRGYGSVCEAAGWDTSGTDEAQTTNAIYQFQRNYDEFMGGNLQVTGVCDYATWQALFATTARIRGCFSST